MKKIPKGILSTIHNALDIAETDYENSDSAEELSAIKEARDWLYDNCLYLEKEKDET